MPTEKRLQKIVSVVNQRQKDIVVILEDTYDPHNAEAVFRSCDAFGIQNIYLCFEKQKPFEPKTIGKSSSSSANKWLDFHIYKSSKQCILDLKNKGYKIFSTVLAQDSCSIFDYNFTKNKIALLLGNEHTGLSQTAIDLSDKKIIIPMRGMIQSFNLSVSASIFLYEITKQRSSNSKSYTLLPENKQQLINSFVKR
jgi:tRNA (guanosine-2'-O-)-methyltransferase